MSPDPGEIEEAKKYPNGWVYRISGSFKDDEAIPPEAVVGAWKVNDRGEISGDFILNPNYKAKK
ncbi:MAG: hypothetical protein G3M70_15610 [Candidatus Nitronauta litoralis]|uniref:Uncharacterized protein n=1 Tax=Candidatus Nitronauta litoralis TaxID=2705533 RepID=A0A7T0G236_9BACT|nr:MAG: hypothetical protein G3M70_15610 [Candidatus Nitronauta litoralis]